MSIVLFVDLGYLCCKEEYPPYCVLLGHYKALCDIAGQVAYCLPNAPPTTLTTPSQHST